MAEILTSFKTKKNAGAGPELQDRCGSGHLRTNNNSVQGILVCETSSSPGGGQVSQKPVFVRSKESWIRFHLIYFGHIGNKWKSLLVPSDWEHYILEEIVEILSDQRCI